MSDLVTLARDADQAARIVVTRQWCTYTHRDMFEVHVLHDDRLWLDCSHGHRTEDTAAKCAARLARRWEDARHADEVVLVNGDTTVEWRWVTGHTEKGSWLGRSMRCRPVAPGGQVSLSDHGPVSEVVRPKRRTA